MAKYAVRYAGPGGGRGPFAWFLSPDDAEKFQEMLHTQEGIDFEIVEVED